MKYKNNAHIHVCRLFENVQNVFTPTSYIASLWILLVCSYIVFNTYILVKQSIELLSTNITLSVSEALTILSRNKSYLNFW